MAELERTTTTPATLQSQGTVEDLPELFGRLGDNVTKFFDAKLNLLKAEVKEDARVYLRNVAMIGVGAVVAVVGLALVNVAIALFVSKLFSFSQPVNYALGFLVTGAIYLALGGGLAVIAKNRMTARNPVPNKSVEELRKDKEWLKNET